MDFIFAQTQTAQSGGLLSFLPFLLIMVILYFFMLRPQAKKQKDKDLMVANLSKGDKVTKQNIKVVRPSFGLQPKFYNKILGKTVNKNIKKGDRVKLEYFQKK